MATIASYLQESQIITLSKDFPALTDPDNLVGFTNPEQFGFFFHEWIHFLHNISTINGFSLFSAQIILWSNFRWTMNNKEVSDGSGGMVQNNIEDNGKLLNYIISNRKWHQCSLPNDVKESNLYFEEPQIHDMEAVNGYVYSTSLIKCTINYSGNKYNIEIGVLEILESVAFMLECECVKKMNGTPQNSPFYPYHIIKNLAGKIAPSLSDEIIICCMLASLQSNDPPQVLFKLLKESESLGDNCRYENLVSRVKEQLAEQDENINKTFTQIHSLFPVDEPMGSFVKLTLNRIKNNLNFRENNPFFELNIIKKVSEQVEQMNDFIKQFGGCTIIQKRYDDDEKPLCDIMYDFKLPEHDESTLFGSKMLRACFHFILLHYKPTGEIVNTVNLDVSSKNKCPFYTVCGSSIRTSNSNVCAESPWKSMLINDNKDCYYASAIKATNPPAESC
ncbi:TPA: hypothetical protein ACIAIE_004245 [Serratia fonticola]